MTSQTADWQARDPRTGVHAPPGTGVPFGSFGAQVPGRVTLLHQLPAPHCASVVHAVLQTPVVRVQNGAPAGHAAVVPLPELPLQGTQAWLVTLQMGVPPVQAVEFVAVHWTH